jgi:hypothetical protein
VPGWYEPSSWDEEFEWPCVRSPSAAEARLSASRKDTERL